MYKKFFLLTLPFFMLFGLLNGAPASANTSNLIVHEFEINGNSEDFVIGMDEATVVRGVVENTGSEDATIELKMNDRYHYERWEIKAGEKKEIESSTYEHRGWYKGTFLMSLGDKEITVEVVDKNEKETTEETKIESFKINGEDKGLRVKDKGEINITAKITNKEEEPIEIELYLEKQTDANPVSQPWPYVELDIEKVRLLGHQSHYENSCSFGAFNAIIQSLQEEIGHPYTQIPTYMLHFGRGGFMGERSTCGALIGATAAINLITGEDYRPLGEELLKYYKETELPTDIWDNYLEMEESPIDPEKYIAEPLGRSAAESGDCEKSLKNWYDETGEEQGSRRNERCGRLTGDIAAKAAELLNEWAKDREDTETEYSFSSNAEFYKSYQVLPLESLEIEENLPYNWEEFSKYTATIVSGDIKETIEIVVADQKEESNALHFMFILALFFLSGIASGFMIKKCPTKKEKDPLNEESLS